jgi:hypothetical protein
MPKVTELARGAVNGADEIVVVLQEDDNQAMIVWPTRPTVTDAKRLNTTVAAVMTILAKASTSYAQRLARKRL